MTDEANHASRVVVTSGAGFIGSHLCDALINMNRDVFCVDNFETGGRRNIDHLLGAHGFRLVHSDVSDVVDPVRAIYEARRFGAAATNAYGPRMRLDDGRLVSGLIKQALTGDPLTVPGTGDQRRSLCHVDDTVAGVLALATSPHPGPINVGTHV